jgi:hypothetical protein
VFAFIIRGSLTSKDCQLLVVQSMVLPHLSQLRQVAGVCVQGLLVLLQAEEAGPLQHSAQSPPRLPLRDGHFQTCRHCFASLHQFCLHNILLSVLANFYVKCLRIPTGNSAEIIVSSKARWTVFRGGAEICLHTPEINLACNAGRGIGERNRRRTLRRSYM